MGDDGLVQVCLTRDVGNTRRYLVHVRRFDGDGAATQAGIAMSPNIAKRILDHADKKAHIEWGQHLIVLNGPGTVYLLRTYNSCPSGIVITEEEYHGAVEIIRHLFATKRLLYGK